MSIPQNINNPSVANASKQTYYNNIYDNYTTISANQSDAIAAFFEKQTGDKESAKTLSSAVIYTCIAQNINPMTVIQELMNMPSKEMSAYLVLFMNTNRVGTSYLGLNHTTETNKYIKRAIQA